jgi:predicted AAA+ superfamily ATPase
MPVATETGKFVIGNELRVLCAGAVRLNRRDACHEAEDFLNREGTLRTVGIVYGMRSTGKTIILRQLAGREAFLNESAYTTLNYGEYAIDEIYKWITNLYKAGIRYFFIDEITWADGFIDRAMEFADVWASYEGVKIILSGTDSLAFTFAKQESLHGRYVQFTTTKMSYPEYFRILAGDILAYVHNGGVFWNKAQPDSEEFEKLRNLYSACGAKCDIAICACI